MDEPIIIVGAGHAGGTVGLALRQQGWSGPITLVGEEPHPPYQRPPLSKAYFQGEMPAEKLLLRPAAQYERQGITLVTGRRVVGADAATRTVTLDDGQRLGWSRLILATGSRPRRLDCPGAALDGVLSMRGIEDADRLRAIAGPGKSLVLIGAGYVGLEAASAARALGMKVTVIEAEPRVLARVTGPRVSAWFEALHRARGVDIRTGSGVEAILGGDRVTAVRLTGGEEIAADAVLVGIGADPCTELADMLGLAVDGGIVVDECGRSSLPDILAIGDCTTRDLARFGFRMRVESVHNAQEQSRAVAATLCGKPAPAPECPWFWSDQYEVKLQTAGICRGHDTEIARPAQQGLSVWYLREGRLIACDAIDAPRDFLLAKKLIAAGAIIPPQLIADPSCDLAAWFSAAATRQEETT